MSSIYKNQKGFIHVLLLLIIILGFATLAAVFIYRTSNSGSSSSKNDGGYSLSIEKLPKNSPFINSYSLKFKWLKYKNTSEGDTITVPELTLADRSENSVTVSVRSKTDKYSNPCAFTEPWNCDKPKLPEATIELPEDFIKLNEKRDLVLRLDGKDVRYKLDSQKYYLSLYDSNEKKVSSIPHYPDGTATAKPTYAGNLIGQTTPYNRKAIDDAQQVCEQYTIDAITKRLIQYGVKLATDTYPGIEKIRPQDVLVLTNVNHVYNGLGDEEASLTPIDSNGCKLVLSGTYY
jgi:hypothetical protein